jgi:hypothetical protein
MSDLIYQKQTVNEPLYKELIWSKPENKFFAGKYLIIGGDGFEFFKSVLIYNNLLKIGAAHIQIILPTSLRKTIDFLPPEAIYLPVTPSGSFAMDALSEMLDLSITADITIISEDVGRNSETQLMFENLLSKMTKKVCLINQTVEFLFDYPIDNISMFNPLIIADLKYIQKLFLKNFKEVIKLSSDFMLNINIISDISNKYNLEIITKQEDKIIVFVGKSVSVTFLNKDLKNWAEVIASSASFYLTNNPGNRYRALTSSIYEVAFND